MQKKNMTEDELLKRRRRVTAENQAFFSNKGKSEREKWVVKEFLSLLHIDFNEEELINPEQASKVDVEFRNARFQIKEIPEPDIRRTKEAKEEYAIAQNATLLREAFPKSVGRDMTPLSRAYDLVVEKTKKLFEEDKYPLETRKHLDLLFYVTRTRAALITQEEIRSDDFKQLGWRSVSVVMGEYVYLLHNQGDGLDFNDEK